ncbi:molybdate ABC transporter permease subunit [Paenibacillus radicis (ex Gao et al. 2016)]|uniref:Molybdenum transport system permease n=1 Tax=Paenibacillus radicis (ex Gao et al. 2016) TaxID=1737354 RepID=A0A917M663_9BACL|nr:molybdate ABC transporter permease subunit [Paenibacillus radicis (ex Gao et al. 2016)]GGG79840.1 putative molybdenum transport system permease protein YvgM [Paenibacillus radicis (ex Gao et al. 2016)]
MRLSDWTWEQWTEPLLLSLRIALVASVIVLALGTLVAWLMTRKPQRGALWLETLFMMPLVLPPTVVGFLLLVLIGRKGWIGQAYEWLFGQPVIFTWLAAVIAAVIVAFPLVYQTMKNGFASVDKHLLEAARSAGAGEWQIFLYISLPLTSRSLMTAYLLGFARSLGEFGATLMVAGNIPGVTQTTPTAIYVAVESGRMGLAWTWTGAVVVISFIMLYLTGRRSDRLDR